MRSLVLIGGYLTGPGDFQALAAALERPPYNYAIFIAPITRWRWAATRAHDFRPVLALLRTTVGQALEATGAERVTLLAHSVGGMAARLFLGDQPYLGQIYGGWRLVERLVTLGTPHTSLERWTLSLYDFVGCHYPGAFYPDMRYVSVVGRALQGRRNGAFRERMARQSYELVAGSARADDWGDGVTPLTGAVLPGAEYLVVPDLHHTRLHGRPWYGDPAALPLWGRVLLSPSMSANALRHEIG